jgi:two-component system, sensor histidine kinase
VPAEAQSDHDEALRLATLRDYGILDTPPEDCFDHIARAAAALLAVPIGAIALVDETRAWFKARVGVAATEMPREHSFCGHSLIEGAAAMVVPDTRSDPRFRDNPFVIGEPYVGFFVGVWLTAPNRMPIGTLCVADRIAHPPPDARQIAALTDLAALAMEAIEVRSAGRAAQETDRINRLVADRLHDAHRGLLAAYRAKSEFFVSLSHELRTPLNAIIGYAELIAAGPGQKELDRGHVAAITEAGRHMLTLVNDILEFSRLEAGEITLAWRQVSLQHVVEEALRMVGAFARSRSVRLRQDVAWTDCVVRGDPVRLKQVLLNLLTNAIKFTPPGGDVRTRLSRDDSDRIVLEIADTGIGIAPADIAMALTPYGQIVQQDGASREGTGLGLPIARALVERHGGTLHIASRPGSGTTVSVVLPPLQSNVVRLAS